MSAEQKPTPINPEPTPQLESGQYVVGQFRGLSIKEGNAKSSGNPYRIVEAVIETDNFNVSRFTLTKAQLEQGFEKKLNEEFTGKTVLMPVSIMLDNGYLRSRMRGNELPKALKS